MGLIFSGIRLLYLAVLSLLAAISLAGYGLYQQLAQLDPTAVIPAEYWFISLPIGLPLLASGVLWRAYMKSNLRHIEGLEKQVTELTGQVQRLTDLLSQN